MKKIKVSVVIPTYNEKNKIINCLKSLNNQTYQKDLIEKVVIDDGSIDGTAQYIKKKFPETIFIQKKNTGAYDSRNKGVNFSTGDIIAFTDSDCLVDENWISNIVKNLSRNNVSIIGGRIFHVNKFLSKVIGVSDFGGYQDKNHKLLNAIPTCNMAVKRIIFNKYRFDPNLRSSGDRLFSWKLIEAGYKLIFCPDVVVTHDPSVKFTKFLERKFRYGKSFVKIRKKYKTLPGAKIIKYHIPGIIILSLVRFILDVYRLFTYRSENKIKYYEILPSIFLFALGRIIFLFGGITQFIKND
jgi:glycosyltransferase involved in cell wall biosynthesis